MWDQHFYSGPGYNAARKRYDEECRRADAMHAADRRACRRVGRAKRYELWREAGASPLRSLVLARFTRRKPEGVRGDQLWAFK